MVGIEPLAESGWAQGGTVAFGCVNRSRIAKIHMT